MNRRISFGILAIILALCHLPLRAQEGRDSLSLKVTYIASFRSYVESKGLNEEEMILEVGTVRRNFYPRWDRVRQNLVDSLTKTGITGDEFMSAIMRYPTSKLFYDILSHYPTHGTRTEIEMIGMKLYYYHEPLNQLQWVLLSDTTTLLGYHCLSAQCNYRGRTWKVFYTPDIPVDAGPWKLWGLPGLILKAQDASGDFAFECVGIEKGHGRTLYSPNLKKHIKSTRKKNMELNRLRAKDYIGFMKQRGVDARGWDANGKPLKYPPRTPLFLDN